MNPRSVLITGLLMLLLAACTGQAATPTPPSPTVTLEPEPTPLPSPTTEPTPTEAPAPETALAPTLSGFVYGDPDGRFSLPLIGDWSLVETTESYARFALADPPLELNALIIETGDLEQAANEAFGEIGVDPANLSLLSEESHPRLPEWNAFIYSGETGQGIVLAAQVIRDKTMAIIVTGDIEIVTADPTLDQLLPSVAGLAFQPLDEYLECGLGAPPTSVAAIDNLKEIEFCSNGTGLVGHLVLPEGAGPFPAIVYTGPGSGLTTRFEFNPYYMPDDGFAIFSYDKRGAGDSEGLFFGVGLETGEWRLPQLADDALAAVAFLQGLDEINPDQIGLAGWSQNGWVIPLAAAQSDSVAFTLINSGPTVSLGEELYWSELTGGGDGMSAARLAEVSEQFAAYDGPLSFDPRPYLEAMSIPGLWILGGQDASIPALESKAILEEIVEEQGKDFTILFYPQGGHGVAFSTTEVAEWIYAHLGE